MCPNFVIYTLLVKMMNTICLVTEQDCDKHITVWVIEDII